MRAAVAGSEEHHESGRAGGWRRDTRLRPLTETVPKPLLPLVDRPILGHVLDHLVVHGVHEVIMSSPYLEGTFHPFIEARGGDPAITWITEREALGTGGAIVSVLDRLGDHPFFALNGDVLTDLDLTAMLASHRERGAAVTIARHHVEDARAFGLVEADRVGRITAFREKPPDPLPGDINAGTYVLEPSALRAWPAGTSISIEAEIFPGLIRDGAAMHAFDDDAYWLDLGTPEQYLRAHVDLLGGRVRGISVPSALDRVRRLRRPRRARREVGGDRRGSERGAGGGAGRGRRDGGGGGGRGRPRGALGRGYAGPPSGRGPGSSTPCSAEVFRCLRARVTKGPG